MAITTRVQIPREVNNFYDRNLLERMRPILLHMNYGQVRDIPSNAGTNVIKFRKFNALPVATTPLSEGVTPIGRQITVTDITSTVSVYGDFVEFTDVVDYESPNNILQEFGEVLGEQAGETLDELARDVITSGTNVRWVNQVARNAITAADTINITTLRAVFRDLQENNIHRITTIIDPDTGYNTRAIGACYVAITTPGVLSTLRALPEWIPVEKYANKGILLEGEEGSIEGFRIIVSPKAKMFAAGGFGGIDVHSMLCIGANAYGITRISGQAIENIIKAPIDPLNRTQTTGWKATFAAKILNDAAMVRVECAA